MCNIHTFWKLETCRWDKYEVCWVLPLKSPSEGLCVDSIGRRGRLQQSSIRVKLQWAGSARPDHTLIKTFYTSWIFLLVRRPDSLPPCKTSCYQKNPVFLSYIEVGGSFCPLVLLLALLRFIFLDSQPKCPVELKMLNWKNSSCLCMLLIFYQGKFCKCPFLRTAIKTCGS